jgi:hypothetical protein
MACKMGSNCQPGKPDARHVSSLGKSRAAGKGGGTSGCLIRQCCKQRDITDCAASFGKRTLTNLYNQRLGLARPGPQKARQLRAGEPPGAEP